MRKFGRNVDEIREIVHGVFEELKEEGFLVGENFLCCQTCAGYEFATQASKLADEGVQVKGCVYWHQQDEENFVESGNLMLAYGDLDTDKHGTIGLPTKEVGDHLAKKLEKAGLEIDWDGDPSKRILITDLKEPTFLKAS